MSSAQRLEQVRSLTALVREMAHEIILPRYLRAARERKADGSVLTEADLASQAALVERLPGLIKAPVLGEEMSAEEQGRVWHQGQHGLWVIDPIDGTTNFVRGFAYTNISVALAKDGQVEYAVVYAPLAGELYAARRGGGATLNGRAIHVSGRDPGHSLVVCGSTIYDRSYTDRHFAILRHLYDRCLDYRRFASAALDCCMVACGRAEIFFECRLSPWDYAAGSLIAQEAGGVAVRLDGSFLDPLRPGSVFISNAACREMRQGLPE